MFSMQDLSNDLCRRAKMGEARTLARATEADLSGVIVELNRCHENVRHWLAVHPEHRHVWGWLITEVWGGGYFFDKHSVVRIGATLLDVTPRRDTVERRFLVQEGASEEFEGPPWQVPG